MPTYDFRCGRCGDFERLRSIATRDAPQACPTCSGPTTRRMGSGPRLGLMDNGTRRLIQTEERGAGYKRLRHPMGCGCCG